MSADPARCVGLLVETTPVVMYAIPDAAREGLAARLQETLTARTPSRRPRCAEGRATLGG